MFFYVAKLASRERKLRNREIEKQLSNRLAFITSAFEQFIPPEEHLKTLKHRRYGGGAARAAGIFPRSN
jgi:hypothetical protein